MGPGPGLYVAFTWCEDCEMLTRHWRDRCLWCACLAVGHLGPWLEAWGRDPVSSPVGIIPDELLAPEKREAMIQYLRRLPIPVRRRKQLAMGWAMMNGAALKAEEYTALEHGVELPG